MVVVKDAKNKDNEDPVQGVGQIIANECKEIDLVKDTYTTHIDMDRVINQVSFTLQRILEDISPLFHKPLFTVTGLVQNKPTQIQLALEILYQQPKTILNYLHKYGIIFSYDQVLRLKKSAAANS